ncbi:Nkb-3p [Sparganum proliferum]
MSYRYSTHSNLSFDPIRDLFVEVRRLETRRSIWRYAEDKRKRQEERLSAARVGKRWLYFFVLYALLAVCFYGYLNLFMYFQIPRDRPKLTGRQSLLQLHPGLSRVPNPDVVTSLVHFRPQEPLSYSKMMDEMLAFLYGYRKSRCGKLKDCVRGTGGDIIDLRRPCAFDLNAVGPCNSANSFGYTSGSPCFALKMNRIYGWLPEPVEFATGVLVKCEGETENDTLNMGTIYYYDMDYAFTDRTRAKTTNGSFHSAFFPFLNQGCYQQPLVFLEFAGIRRNTLIRVKCYLIAKNIPVNFEHDEGSVKFEILAD